MNLKHYDQFKQILADYQMSDHAKETFEGLKLVLFLAPTSSGRNTLIKELLKTGEYHFIISDTTRPPRINNGVLERNGVEYWFRDEEEVLADLQTGKYLEAEILHEQQVSGISVRELQKAKGEHKVAITDIDLQGVYNIIKVKPDALVMLILPPSFDEWQRRIKDRGIMTEDEYRRRLQTASRIFESALAKDDFVFVINDKIEDSVKKIHNIVKGQIDLDEQKQGRHLTKQLLKELKGYF